MISPGRSHWLNIVAAHSGLQLSLPDQPRIDEIATAWPNVAAATGMSDEAFTQRVAGHFRVEVADLERRDPQAVKLIPKWLAQRYAILPLRATESTIHVAIADPSTPEVRREIMA